MTPERCRSNAGDPNFMRTELGFEASSATVAFASSASSPALGDWSDSLLERRSVLALVAARVPLVDAVVTSITGSSVPFCETKNGGT